MSQLRPYQSEDKASIIEAWKEYRSILYQLPTGGGKSVVLTSIIQDYKHEQIIVFAHKRKLLFQLRDHLKRVGITAGVLAGQFQENLDSNIIIVSIRTAVKDARLESLLERDWNKVIIDEARHSRTASYDKVLDALLEKHPNHRLLGVDATPYRKDKKRLDKHFQHMVVSSETIASLTEKGFLQKCKTIVSPINIEDLQEQVKEVANDYQITSLSNYMRQPKYLNYVVSQYITYGEQRQAIVFAVDKAHAKDLAVVFEDNGYEGRVVRIDSDMSETEIEQAYQLFEDKKAQILINVEMITEGVDLPSVGCIVGARPTKSMTLYFQMIGRGMRLDGIHDYFINLDCCGWTEEYGVATTPKHWSLNPEIDPNGARIGNKIFGKNMITGELEEDLTDYIGEVIEMTPEEYLQSLQGGKEKAVQINISIDDKIKNLFEAVISLIMAIEGIYKDFYVEFEYDNYEHKKIVQFFHHDSKGEGRSAYSRMRAELTFEKDRRTGKQTIYSTMVHGYDSSKHFDYLKLTKLVGDLNSKLLKDDNKTLTAKSFELLEQIADLNKSKINLEQFKQAEEQMKADQFKQSVDDHVKINKIFDLSNSKLNYGSYFKESWMGNMGGDIVKIELPDGKIKGHHNTIILHVKKHEGWQDDPANPGKSLRTYKVVQEEKKYIKGDRVYEMIKDGRWNIEVEV